MWPEESFGGVSDEQFWDDLASDKPLATTARTAQPDGAPLPSPASGRPRLPEPGLAGPNGPNGPNGPAGPGSQRHADRRPAEALPLTATTQAFPASPSQAAQGTTQAFKIPGGTAAQTTGPQPVRSGTGPQPVTSPPQSQPVPVRPTPPAQAGPPAHSFPPGQLVRPATQPQPLPAAHALPAPQHALPAPQHALPAPQHALPAPQQAPAAYHSRPSHGHGRHASGEDPLTSSAYSLRSNGGVDGRSYQASRRSRELTRDQYEAAISQETQTFSVVDSDSGPAGYQASTPPYGYELPPAAPRRAPEHYRPSHDGYGTGGYSQPGQPGPGTGSQTPPYGENYGYEPRPGRHAPGRPAVKGGRPADPARGDRQGYPDRPAYPADRPAYQNGYPGPYDSRGNDRRG